MWRLVMLSGLAMAVILGGCTSGSDDASDGDASADVVDEPTDRDRPDGPAATIGEPLEGGEGIFLPSASGGIADTGGVVTEYPVSGTAVSYTASDLPTDGFYELSESESADYRSRIVVRLPEDPDDFNGTVVVEWLNVSGGVDAAPELTYLFDEVDRGGYAWVGVSAQRIGIEGGDVAVQVPGGEEMGTGAGLKTLDPERYGDLSHPGDAFSYDIYSQVGRALRESGESNPLADLDVERVLAVGESQSGFALTTYANGVQPVGGVYDGFLIHSRGGAAAPLGEPDAGIDIAGTIGGEPTLIRDDLDVPTIVVETETDVLGILNYFPARQPDSELFRLWEVAGTAHADAYQLGEAEEMLGCSTPINRGQQSFVLKAALRHLDNWAGGGEAAPKAERLNVDASGTTYEFDDVGNVTGGVRLPSVEVATDVLSGQAPADSSVVCLLMGSTTPIPTEILQKQYAGSEDYLQKYEESTDAAIEAGFVLEADRDAMLDEASPERFDD